LRLQSVYSKGVSGVRQGGPVSVALAELETSLMNEANFSPEKLRPPGMGGLLTLVDLFPE
jgi:hypothetical protein